MIASDDVRRVTFDRAMRGYRCEDVDDYLKQVADSIDSLAAENDDLQKKLVILAQRIDQYRADEDTLSTTMINAQRLGENVIKEAKQKAAEIIRAANIKAEDREQRARDEVELAQQELVTIKQEADAFKKRLMDLYRQHIEMIAKIPEYHTNRAEQQAVQLKAVTREEYYEFYVIDGAKEVFLGRAQAKYLSSEVAGGFTGVVMGLYAVDEQENWAEFRNFYWKQGR